MKTTENLVNLGYSTNEPSVHELAYFYYLKFFEREEARELAASYCEELEKKL